MSSAFNAREGNVGEGRNAKVRTRMILAARL